MSWLKSDGSPSALPSGVAGEGGNVYRCHESEVLHGLSVRSKDGRLTPSDLLAMGFDRTSDPDDWAEEGDDNWE